MDPSPSGPDGAVDVVDYKSAAERRSESYAFQLDIYGWQRERYPEAMSLGRAFVPWGGTGEPVWRPLTQATW